METLSSTQAMASGTDMIRSGLERLLASDLTPSSVHDATLQIRAIGELQSMIDAAAVRSMDAIEASGVHRSFGHGSAKVMVRHEAKLSNAEALGRDQTRRALRDLPDIADAYATGTIGTCQVRRIARIWANPRVRDLVASAQVHFIIRAQTMPYKQFHAYACRWEERADEDGTIDRTERQHRNRNVVLDQDYDNSWDLRGGLGPTQGADCKVIFDHYVRAEYLADLASAKEQRLDPNDPLEMPRTNAQRRADAFWQICQDAASSAPGALAPRLVLNNVIDHETFQRELARLEGETPPADNPDRATYQCRTLDGYRLDPTEVVERSLRSEIRRIVVGADGVTIDQGRARCFSGHARHATMVTATECFWPGCHIPVSEAQIDHLLPHSEHGRTAPFNGAPACAKHNRHKHTERFTVCRSPEGELMIRNRHGTRVE